MIADVARAAAEVGLELQPDKTKILHNGIGYGAGVTQTSCNGMSIEVWIISCDVPWQGFVFEGHARRRAPKSNGEGMGQVLHVQARIDRQKDPDLAPDEIV